MKKGCLSNSYKPPQSLHRKGGSGANANSVAFNIRSIKGPAMTILSDQNRHPGFLRSGQLTLLGGAIIVLLIFAWSFVAY